MAIAIQAAIASSKNRGNGFASGNSQGKLKHHQTQDGQSRISIEPGIHSTALVDDTKPWRTHAGAC